MYTPLLTLHSWVRWLALAAAVAAVLLGWSGWLGRKPFGAGARKALLAFVVSMDLQLVLGLVLYVSASPIAEAARANMGQAMKDPHLRFWGVEHITTMFLAVVALHVGNVLVRRAPDDRARWKRLALTATIALVLVLVAIPWPGRVVGRPLFRF
jgi:hypothetical protein